MEKKDILLIISGVAILIVIAAIAYLMPPENSQKQWTAAEGVKILTDKGEYSPGEMLKVKIENNSEEKFCFSSCYPYYIQKKNGGWETYRYVDCPQEDVVDNCVAPKSIKAFELEVPPVSEGPHRLAISACLSCQIRELFKKEKSFFSNRFFVK